MLTPIVTARPALSNDELHPNGHKVWKRVTITRFPQGAEVLIDSDYHTWSEPDPHADELEKVERGEGDREASIERASRRAKGKVRKLAKMMMADQMLTLVYRENMQDEKRLQRDFKALVARLRTLGPFEYVATVERQQRGALHMHVACQSFPAFLKNHQGIRVKSYNLIRSMWRHIVGPDNGNVDLTKPRRNRSHRIASYIAKYVSKGFAEGALDSKRYWASRGTPKPTIEHLYFEVDTDSGELLGLIVGELFELGYDDFTQYRDKGKAFYWLAATIPS